MINDLLQALISAGIAPVQAQRLAESIRKAARDEQKSYFTAAARPGSHAAPGSQEAFALYASAPATYDPESKTFGAGAAAFGVSGLALLDGQLAVRGDSYVGSLYADGSVTASGVGAKKVTCEEVGVRRAADIKPSGVVIHSPLTAESTFVSRQGGHFAGFNTFDGPVVISDRVFWNGGERKPAAIDIPYKFATAAPNIVSVQRRRVAVLNDYGAAPVSQSMNFSITAASASPSIAGSVQLFGSTVSVVTGVTFNPDTCQLSTTTTPVFNCTGATFSGFATGGPFISASPYPTINISVA